ncbi:peptidase S8/S53 domain-containing protein [Chytridium lagenaria]|nr:peptidase S8/S53 domain-containing protein [Chytridium lagenaria]
MPLFSFVALALLWTAIHSSAAPPPLSPTGKIPNQYIVVYHKTTTAADIDAHEQWIQTTAASEPVRRRAATSGGKVFPALPRYEAFGILRKYGRPDSFAPSGEFGFKGYAAKMTAEMAEVVKTLSEVAIVEQDAVFGITATQVNPPSWGLKRVGTADLPLPSNFVYPDSAGAGTRVYIIDTGIDITHPNFNGRAIWGGNFAGIAMRMDTGMGRMLQERSASTLYGVAKSVTLYAVKVLDSTGAGTTSSVIAGIDYVASQVPQNSTGVFAIANMSLGGDASESLDLALEAATATGIAFAVAAGNDGKDACLKSPARAKGAVTVAASDQKDVLADFSNYGSCVDLIGPGVSITSTIMKHILFLSYKFKSTNVLSGTSMASPHVAGAMALLLSLQPYATVPSLINATSSSPLKTVSNPSLSARLTSWSKFPVPEVKINGPAPTPSPCTAFRMHA